MLAEATTEATDALGDGQGEEEEEEGEGGDEIKRSVRNLNLAECSIITKI